MGSGFVPRAGDSCCARAAGSGRPCPGGGLGIPAEIRRLWPARRLGGSHRRIRDQFLTSLSGFTAGPHHLGDRGFAVGFKTGKREGRPGGSVGSVSDSVSAWLGSQSPSAWLTPPCSFKSRIILRRARAGRSFCLPVSSLSRTYRLPGLEGSPSPVEPGRSAGRGCAGGRGPLPCPGLLSHAGVTDTHSGTRSDSSPSLASSRSTGQGGSQACLQEAPSLGRAGDRPSS